MRYKVIWITAALMILWMVCAGVSLARNFDRVQQSNRATAELKWTFICDDVGRDFQDISIIEGGSNFICESYNAVDFTIIDKTGKTLSDEYHLLESIGDGYVRFEYTPPGKAIMEDGKNKRTSIGVLDNEGQELPEDEAMKILYGEKSAEKGGGYDGYRVEKGDKKYVGIKDNAGNWVIPPAFDKIEITSDGRYAVIKNSQNIGIAELGE